MRRVLAAILGSQQFGLLLVILLLGLALTLSAGSHIDRQSGALVNNFLNSGTLLQVLTDASFFAIMAVGMTMVIVSGGIDLSVGAIYAFAGVIVGLTFRSQPDAGIGALGAGLALACGVGLLCGAMNGLMSCFLRVHPFIVTLGTMLIFRGLAFVTTKAESILLPQSFTGVAKATLGMGGGLYPMPMLTMVLVTTLGWLYLAKMVAGRRVFAVGGNVVAARYAGLRVNAVLVGVYALSGLTAAIAAFLGGSYYGSVSSSDGSGYELFVIASAVVGGASLQGGRGSALGAMLGALLIALMRQSVRTLRFDQNYEQIVIGCAIIAAVVLDRVSTGFAADRAAKRKVQP